MSSRMSILDNENIQVKLKDILLMQMFMGKVQKHW